jgi:RHS repeat-associated protein
MELTLHLFSSFHFMSITALEGHHQIVNRYGYTGEWWEDEVGLLYLRARWYAPETGSFLSRDSVEGEPPYLYVRGNPVTLADPSGQDPCTDDDPLTICHTPPIGGGTPTIPPDPISTSPRPLPPISVPDSRCTGAPYVECVPPPPLLLALPQGPEFRAIEINSCEYFDWFSAPGYAEGGGQSFSSALNIVDIVSVPKVSPPEYGIE